MKTEEKIVEIDVPAEAIAPVKRKIVIVYQTAFQSFISDAATLATVTIPIGLGWLMQSPAMQWLGFIMSLLLLVAKAQGRLGGVNTKLTPAQAIEWLKTIADKQS